MRKLCLLARIASIFILGNQLNAAQIGFYEFEGDLSDSLCNLADAFQSEGPFVGSGDVFPNGNNGLVTDPIRGNVFDLTGGGEANDAGGIGNNGGLNLTLPVAGNQTGAWGLAMFMLTPPGVESYLFDNRETAAGTMSAGPDSLILNVGQNSLDHLSVYTGSWHELGSPDIDDGLWHHIAWSYDGSVLTSYVDGVPGSTPATVSIQTDLLFNNIELGNEGTGSGAGGQTGRLIDDVRIFDSAIGDIISHMGQDGDFDGDNDVDGADFLAWQRGEASGCTDTNLMLWQRSYGAPGNGPLVIAAPEPSTLLLTVIFSITLVGSRIQKN